MFREIIENVLEFIGSHSEQHGCRGSELLSFVSMDVLPCYALAQHTTLQQTVMDLLISEGGDFTVKRSGKSISPSELTGSLLGYDQCVFCPTVALQERVIGISLRAKNIRAAVNFACDHLLKGFRRYQQHSSGKRGTDVAGEQDKRVSTSGLGNGIRRLMREQWLRVIYVYESSDVPVAAYLLPHFAVPPPHGRPKQLLRPLESYLARRREQLHPPRIIIDVNLVRRIVLSSPERRLVLEDAIHAIFAAHGYDIPTLDGRKVRFSVRRMLVAAGLRVVKALIVDKCKTHTVQVVVESGGTGFPGCEGKNNNSDDEHSSSSSSSDLEDNDDDDDDTETVSNVGKDAPAGAVQMEGKGGDIFCVDPSYPLALQVAKEAERQPLAVESVLPRVILYDMRATYNELRRFTRQYEESWGTIESISVLCRHSKSFTRLLRPKGWDDAHLTTNALNNNEVTDASLPKGVSQWSVNTVMEALRAAPLHALTLNRLTQIVDRRTLGRLLPYLRDEGHITTTGVTLGREKRVGVVALAGVEMNEEVRSALAQAYMDVCTARDEEREKTKVVLQRLPELVDGGPSHSPTAPVITKPCARGARLVAKITMVRNGYCRVGMFRLSRLHVELCRVWWILGQAPEIPLTVERVLQEMTLSSFCIIIGISDVDVSEYVGAVSAEMGCRWKTPIRLLPPSLQEYCRRSGVQPLLHSLSGLQLEGLVLCDRPLAAYLDVPLAELSIELSATPYSNEKDDDDDDNGYVWQPRCDYPFFTQGEDNTADNTCRAVLRYWNDRWATFAPTIRGSHRVVALIKEVVETEPNPTNVQLIALSQLLRIDSGILTEYMLQRQGITRQKKRSLRERIQTDKRQRRHEKNRSGPRRRVEVNGVTVAGALEAVLQSDDPCGGLARLRALLQRHGKPLHRSGYNPYNTPIYGSMQTLMQSIMSPLDNQMERNPRPELMKMTVASVVSPNLATGPDITTNIETNTRGDAHRRDAERLQTAAVEENLRINEPPEILQDIMRMILLSDEAHYNAAAASVLLSQFSYEEQCLCIDWLLMFPAFRARTGGSGRLPRIELSPIPTLLPATLVAGVMHQKSAMANFAQDVATELLLAPQASIHNWCVPPVVLDEGIAEGKWVQRAPHLVQQPSLDLDSIAEEIREQKGLGTLRLPRFAWPSLAVETPKAPPLQGGKPSTFHSASVTPPVSSFPEVPTTLASAQQSVELYPARAILRSWRRLQHLELRDIPVDGPPTAEQVSVARSGVLMSRKTSSSPWFPSVFHHVDGSFHEFVWRSFLFAVYAHVHHHPGITEEQLLRKLKKGGLVSNSSCRMALGFLKASLVIVTRRMLLPCDEETQSPFTSSGEGGWCQHECYFCAISQDGPWRMTEL